jgi:hypothetical protein
MFQRIVVAYSESPESRRALAFAIQLAKALRAELHAVITMQDLAVCKAYATAADPSLIRVLDDDPEQLSVESRNVKELNSAPNWSQMTRLMPLSSYSTGAGRISLLSAFIGTVRTYRVCGARCSKLRRTLLAAFLEFTRLLHSILNRQVLIAQGK